MVAVEALHPVPDHVTAETAVATIGTGRTAVGVLEIAALTSSDTVLIPAAAGGLGALLVQAARRAGAEVVALAGGAEKAATAKRLGATFAVDSTDARWPETVRDLLDGRAGGPISVVLDGVGGDTGRAAVDLLAPGGRLVVFGFSSGTPTETTRDDVVVETTLGRRMLDRPGGIRSLETAALAAVTAGELTPLVGPPFALADAAAAHAALESRATVGKVVLLP